MTLTAVETEIACSSYEPNAKQQAFHAHPAQFRLLLGAYGASKTTMMVWEDFELGRLYPGSVGAIFRKTYPALRDTTQRQYFDELPPELLAACKLVRTEGREEIEYPWGSRTLFRCLDDFRKLGSAQYDRITVDEAGEVGEQEGRALAYGRLRGRVGPRRMMFATNPVDDDHWLYRFFVDEADETKKVFHFSTYDNARVCNGYLIPHQTYRAPKAADIENGTARVCPEGAVEHTHLNVPDSFIRNLEKLPDHEKRMYLYGQWGSMAKGKPYFHVFRPDLHIGNFTTIPGRPIVRGWDWGYYHPACVWLQTDAMGYTHVLHELLGDQEHVEPFAHRVLQETQQRFPGCPVTDYGDVAGRQRSDRGPAAVDILRKRFGVHVHTRKVGREKSLEYISRLLGNIENGGVPLLRLHESCRILRKALASGYYTDPRTGEPTGDNLYDHLIDALRYALAPAIYGASSSPYDGRPLSHWRAA